jgi:Aldo/keto reductase family
MPLPETSRFELTSNLTICRILNGMWQVSGAHGYIEPKRAVEEMFTYHDAGFTTWDLADHYGPAEDFVGEFRKEFAARRGRERLSEIQAFTKWVPRPGPMTRRPFDRHETEAAINLYASGGWKRISTFGLYVGNPVRNNNGPNPRVHSRRNHTQSRPISAS